MLYFIVDFQSQSKYFQIFQNTGRFFQQCVQQSSNLGTQQKQSQQNIYQLNKTVKEFFNRRQDLQIHLIIYFINIIKEISAFCQIKQSFIYQFINIMSLPQISIETKQKLKADFPGQNQLYSNMKLPNWATPRTYQYNFITYGLTALSAIGYLLAKRGGYLASPFGIAFIANPFIALMHKREVDNYYVSDYTNFAPEQLLEKYPTLKEGYYTVLNQVNLEIQKQKQHLRKLQTEQ